MSKAKNLLMKLLSREIFRNAKLLISQHFADRPVTFLWTLRIWGKWKGPIQCMPQEQTDGRTKRQANVDTLPVSPSNNWRSVAAAADDVAVACV